MIVFVALVLMVLTSAFIAYPLFRQKQRPVDSVGDEQLHDLHSRRDTTYSMLKELEFDFQSGILTEEDYRDLEVSYKRKAISILKGIDDLEKSTGMEDEIEKQVQKLRQRKALLCPQCGALYQRGDRFCPQCGTRLSADGRPS